MGHVEAFWNRLAGEEWRHGGSLCLSKAQPQQYLEYLDPHWTKPKVLARNSQAAATISL
jgi:hypothetical protein